MPSWFPTQPNYDRALCASAMAETCQDVGQRCDGIAPCRAMDIKLAALRASADLTRQWLVVDLDAFFASVEELDDPTLVSPVLLCCLSSVTLPAVCLDHVESCRVSSSLGSLQASTS